MPCFPMVFMARYSGYSVLSTDTESQMIGQVCLRRASKGRSWKIHTTPSLMRTPCLDFAGFLFREFIQSITETFPTRFLSPTFPPPFYLDFSVHPPPSLFSFSFLLLFPLPLLHPRSLHLYKLRSTAKNAVWELVWRSTTGQTQSTLFHGRF